MRSLVSVGRLYTAAEVRVIVDQLAGERDAAWFEVMDRRYELTVAGRRVLELEAQAADHPSRIAELAAEVEVWAVRCGAAEADLEAVRAELAAARVELAAARRGLAVLR